MHKSLLIFAIALLVIIGETNANNLKDSHVLNEENQNDAVLPELDLFWNEVSRTVREGDFEGYKATYHEDAVVVFTHRENKGSVLISGALADWKQDFTDVQTGKRKNSVEFRFSQRVNSENTAHETGIFYYTSIDKDGKYVANSFIRFEGLLIKRDDTWYMLMEYQKSKTTEAEWEALK